MNFSISRISKEQRGRSRERSTPSKKKDYLRENRESQWNVLTVIAWNTHDTEKKTGYLALQMQEVRKDICRFGWQESALLEADSLRTSQSCQLNEFGEFFHLILFVQQSAINAKFSFFY